MNCSSNPVYHPPTALISGFPSQAIINPISWLYGWNFTADLYRILEHAMDDFHRQRPSNISAFSLSDLFTRGALHQSVVHDKVMSMRAELPPRFKETKPIAQNGRRGLEDKFSFQAANITATLQLIRIILFNVECLTVDQKCAIARDILDNFAKPLFFFLRAISSSFLHHLAGIRSILGSVIEGPLSESSYLQVREVLYAPLFPLPPLTISPTFMHNAKESRLALANLLSSLQVGITSAVGRPLDSATGSRILTAICAHSNSKTALRLTATLRTLVPKTTSRTPQVSSILLVP